ncbi:MAG TPA: helix-turn-helix transcriptional regulator [Streptosporangiaceae bacterium]|nr:helix-turn-helix transcriptional regulator [Streptosporangiaceae bacterium]
MSDDAYGATVAKRRLSRRLTELRHASGHTANHVCDLLGWGRGKVGRFEANLWKRPEMSDIRDLLRIYQVDEAQREEFEQLAVLARARAWWRDYPDVFENEFPGYENDAARIRVFMPLLIPGLLQTRDYMEAHLRFGSRPPTWRQRAMAARLRRQEILDRADGTLPTIEAVITEASLMYRWGSKSDRRDLIEHLLDLSARPNIDLRIQRFEDGPPQGMFSPVNIFDLPGLEPGIVFTETDTAIQEVSQPDLVDDYGHTFDRAKQAALEPLDTAAYLRYLSQRLE